MAVTASLVKFPETLSSQARAKITRLRTGRTRAASRPHAVTGHGGGLDLPGADTDQPPQVDNRGVQFAGRICLRRATMREVIILVAREHMGL